MVAALACLFARAETRAGWRLAATLVTLALGIVLWASYDIGGAAVAVCRTARNCLARFAWALGIDGIALMLIMLSVFLMPICIGASWACDRKRVGRIYGRVPVDGIADDRRVCGAGSVPVLHLLRSRPDPDVSDYRHLGRRRTHLRQL